MGKNSLIKNIVIIVFFVNLITLSIVNSAGTLDSSHLILHGVVYSKDTNLPQKNIDVLIKNTRTENAYHLKTDQNGMYFIDVANLQDVKENDKIKIITEYGNIEVIISFEYVEIDAPINPPVDYTPIVVGSLLIMVAFIGGAYYFKKRIDKK